MTLKYQGFKSVNSQNKDIFHNLQYEIKPILLKVTVCKYKKWYEDDLSDQETQILG